jgi:tetratricopeptide (TPR) repeat protein
MSRTLKGALVLAAAVGLYQAAPFASGSGTPSMPSSSGSASKSPEERAIDSYKSGDDHRLKGKKFEEQAMEKSGAERDKLVAKAKGEYEKSYKDFKSASQINPKLFQAYNGMGFALRKTGDYAKALEMYDQAIKMAEPQGFFAEAVEYRAEAYLGLNRIDDAKKAYLDLFAADRKQADLLMAAMKQWVEQRKANPAGVDATALAGFEKWVGERTEVAKVSRLMATSTSHGTW